MKKTPKGRARLSREAKLALVNEWERSGQSAEVFSARKGVGRNSLYKWRRELSGRRRPREAQFRRVAIRTGPPEGQVQVRGPGGVEVTVGPDTNEAALILTLRAMAKCG